MIDFKRLDIKVYMAGLLLVLAVIGIFKQGFNEVLPQLAIAVLTALALEFILHFLKTKQKAFSLSALITGLIIALVLSPQSKWYICLVVSVAAILQKYIIRYRGKHLFNPANFGLLVVMFIFSAQINWWGQSFWPLIIILGLFICYKMKRLILPLVFTLSFTILNNLLNRISLLDSLLLINIFFVFVMLIEPKTSPTNKKGMAVYATMVAVFSALAFKFIPQYDFSILALACTNALVPLLNRLK